MKCKFCGAEVKLGERCQYCGSVAEAFYYKPEEPPEVVGRNQTDRKEYTVQKVTAFGRLHRGFTETVPPAMHWHTKTALRTQI